MPLTPGPCKGRIVTNRVKEINSKVAVVLTVQLDSGDATEVLIFCTDKSFGFARRQLKLCGFDVDAQELEELEDNPRLLDGRAVPLMVELYNGKLRAQIDTNIKPEKFMFQSAQAGLRSAKKHGFDEPGPADDPPPHAEADEPPAPASEEIPF